MELVILTKLKLRTMTSKLMLLSRSLSERNSLSSEMSEKRKKFWEQEKKWESMVDYNILTKEEKRIHQCHKEAVEKGHFTYDDPATNQRELTRLRHFLKGACCGKACRHCIYDHEKVPEIKKKGRRYNSAFWVYEEHDQELDDLAMFNLRKPRSRPL